MGPIRICRALLRGMAKRGSGSVVNIGSDWAKQPEPTMMDYGVCKAGLLFPSEPIVGCAPLLSYSIRGFHCRHCKAASRID